MQKIYLFKEEAGGLVICIDNTITSNLKTLTEFVSEKCGSRREIVLRIIFSKFLTQFQTNGGALGAITLVHGLAKLNFGMISHIYLQLFISTTSHIKNLVTRATVHSLRLRKLNLKALTLVYCQVHLLIHYSSVSQLKELGKITFESNLYYYYYYYKLYYV